MNDFEEKQQKINLAICYGNRDAAFSDYDLSKNSFLNN